MIKIIKLFKSDRYPEKIFLKITNVFKEEEKFEEEGLEHYMIINLKTGAKIHEEIIKCDDIFYNLKPLNPHEVIFNKSKKNIVYKLYVILNRDFKKKSIKLHGQIFLYISELLMSKEYGGIIRELKKDFKYNEDENFFKYLNLIKGIIIENEKEIL